LRGVVPALLPGLAAVVALGAHGYWIACLSRLWRVRAEQPACAPE